MNRIERDKKQPTTLTQDGIYSFREATEILHVSTPTLKKFIRSNMIRASKLGGQWFITGRAILDALDGNCENRLNRDATK